MVKPLAALSLAQAQQIQWLLTDVDDTLTWQGKLPPESIDAMNQLGFVGIKVVAVTGACAGWCDQMARLWPVHAVIGENGAFWMQQTAGAFHTHSLLAMEQLRVRQQQLIGMLQAVLSRYPGIAFASDQAFRFSDVAINLGQNRAPVPDEVAAPLLAEIRALTLDGNPVKATQSSIHINVWVGEYSKRLTSELFLRHHTNFAQLALESVAYIGDSRNDESMFAWLSSTFGVNNLRPLLNTLNAKPRYMTNGNGGYGFAELAEQLVQSRNGNATC